jgi:putative phosphoesterase
MGLGTVFGRRRRQPLIDVLGAAVELGVISDTHGLVRAEALETLAGVELILHAGDVGRPEVLVALQAVAPVIAVHGNVDGPPLVQRLPATRVVEVGPARLFLLHDLARIDRDPRAEGLAAVISGHSHEPSATTRHGVLYLNPGSAGPCRFGHPVSLGRLTVHQDGRLTPRLISLSTK